MRADDIQQRLIGKALFVVTNRRRCIDASKDRCLTRSTLGPAFYTQTGVRGYDDSAERSFACFTLKYCQRLGIAQSIERIVWSSRSDSQAINEKKKHRH